MARFSLLLRSRPVPPALRAVECAARRPALCFAVREDDKNSGGGMIVREKNLPAEVGKSKDLPARPAADVIAEMAAKVARYPAKPKEAWEGMSAEEMWQRGNRHWVKGEMSEAAKWYYRSAEQGDANSQYVIGMMCRRGEGVPQDYAEAAKWIRRAAEREIDDAQFYLGVSYANGEGVPKDDAEAVKWYRRAAEQGDEYAQEALARISGQVG